MLHIFTVINEHIIGTIQQSVMHCYKLMNIKTNCPINPHLILYCNMFANYKNKIEKIQNIINGTNWLLLKKNLKETFAYLATFAKSNLVLE